MSERESVEEFIARGGKPIELAIGVTAQHKTITEKARIHQALLREQGEKFTEPTHIRRNTKKSKSGHQNIRIQKNTIAVQLGHGLHKSFPKGDNEAEALRLALECRDKCRAAMGLPPAEY